MFTVLSSTSLRRLVAPRLRQQRFQSMLVLTVGKRRLWLQSTSVLLMGFSTPSRRYGGVIYSRLLTTFSKSTVKKVYSGQKSQMICDGGSSVVRVPRVQHSRTARSRTISIETATYFWSFATMVTHFTDSQAPLTLEGLEESSHLDSLSSAYLGRHPACSTGEHCWIIRQPKFDRVRTFHGRQRGLALVRLFA